MRCVKPDFQKRVNIRTLRLSWVFWSALMDTRWRMRSLKVTSKSKREKGLARLEKRVRSGKISKNNINNKGYNKYLKLEGEIKVSINMEKFRADAGWDGLKGYISNTNLTKDEIITNYSHLWKIQ